MSHPHARSATGIRRRLVLAAIGLLAVAGVACLGVVVLNKPAPAQHSTSPSAAPLATREPAAPMKRSLPVRLKIPALGVSSSIIQLGLTPTGVMEVPVPGPHYDKAGWYRYSPTPGVTGPAVIVGHIDSKKNGPSVFHKLGDLRPRDTLSVLRADGSVAAFSVDEVRRYPKANFPTKLVYGDTKHAALRLITCGGPFDRASGHYRDNTIVFASLVTAA